MILTTGTAFSNSQNVRKMGRTPDYELKKKKECSVTLQGISQESSSQCALKAHLTGASVLYHLFKTFWSSWGGGKCLRNQAK